MIFKKNFFLLIFAALFFVFGCDSKSTNEKDRIICLTPTITEIVAELGCGENIVGITKFCDFPQKLTEKIPKIGGFFDSSLEVILSLKPTIAFGLKSQIAMANDLKNNGVTAITFSNDNLAEIDTSILTIGEKLNCSEKAQILVKKLHENIDKSRVKEVFSKQKILIVTSRSIGNDFNTIYIAGNGSAYGDILKKIGVINAFNSNLSFSQTGYEGIFMMQPDVIIEMVPDAEKNRISEDSVQKFWQNFSEIPAVKNKKVFMIKDVVAVRLGVRYDQIAEIFSKKIQE